MNRAQLIASRALWRRRWIYRQRKVDIVRSQAKSGEGDATKGVVTAEEAQQIKKWEGLRDEAKLMVARRDDQLGGSKPKMITAAGLGLGFQYVFGTKGSVFRGAGHYTAGHRSANAEALKAEMRNDHAFHKSKGWGGLSYEAMVADDGTIGFGNPIDRKSAAVASNNTGMVNICCPGTTGHRMTDAQKRSVRWLLDNWHTSKVPKAHRLPKPAKNLTWRGHKEFPGQSTACPGDMLSQYKEIW
jgi:hypothetical protein